MSPWSHYSSTRREAYLNILPSKNVFPIGHSLSTLVLSETPPGKGLGPEAHAPPCHASASCPLSLGPKHALPSPPTEVLLPPPAQASRAGAPPVQHRQQRSRHTAGLHRAITNASPGSSRPARPGEDPRLPELPRAGRGDRGGACSRSPRSCAQEPPGPPSGVPGSLCPPPPRPSPRPPLPLRGCGRPQLPCHPPRSRPGGRPRCLHGAAAPAAARRPIAGPSPTPAAARGPIAGQHRPRSLANGDCSAKLPRSDWAPAEFGRAL